MIPGSANPLLLASAAAGGYQVQRSLRFNSSDSGFCSRTPAVAGNRRTWTWAGWVKRSAISFSAEQHIWGVTGTTDDTYGEMYFGTGDTLRFGAGYNTVAGITTTRVFRDPGAWFHLVLAFDATQATAANKIRLYVNGVEETAFSSDTRSSLANQDWGYNNNVAHYIGRNPNSNIRQFNGYLADIHFIDGQALTPSSFTEVSATTGQLIPKAYSGSFGTNGFWLKFSDNSAATAATLGKDYSGNSNNWTPNNLSVTAGAGNDSLVDTPTSISATDTGVGGEIRGNYCTLNPLNSGGSGTPTLTNGNLDFSLTASVGAIGTHAMGSIAVTAGKYYWEVNLTSNYLNAIYIGLMRGADYNTYHNTSSGGVLYYGNSGNKVIDGVFTSYGNSYTNNDIIGIALDVDAGTVTFYKNNSSQGAITLPSSTSGWKAYVGNGSSGGTQAGVINFGQRAFAYPLSGFKALCDTNLPAPLTAKPNTLMDVALYTGNGGTQTISGLAFEPDFVWLKGRSVAYSHQLYDQVRGAGKLLNSNSTSGESTVTDNLTAFTSAGFTLGNDAGTNQSSATYVAWTWDAGTSTVSNTAGSITSQVRANVSAGFSVVTWTSPSSGDYTIGHGLGVAPSLVITKSRSAGGDQWYTFHRSVCTSTSNYLKLSSTDGLSTFAGAWGATLPTSTVVGLNAGGGFIPSSATAVAYAFAPVVGYSAMGSYVGGGSEYPFVYCGFRPRLVIIKNASTGGTFYDWFMLDTARNPYNFGALNSDSQYTLFANTSGQEQQWLSLDILSNGFRVIDQSVTINGSGSTFVWAAFAESPFQYARAR